MHTAEAFQGEIWRVTAQRRDALAEIGDRLALEPVWRSRIESAVHRIIARTDRMLRFADLDGLAPLGVDARRYASFDRAATQALAAVAYFLEFDGLIVPSARFGAQSGDLHRKTWSQGGGGGLRAGGLVRLAVRAASVATEGTKAVLMEP